MRRLAARLRPHPGQRQRLPAAHPRQRLPVPVRRPVLAAGRAEPRLARVGLPAVPRRRVPQGALAHPVRQAHGLGAALGPHARDGVDRAAHPRRPRQRLRPAVRGRPARRVRRPGRRAVRAQPRLPARPLRQRRPAAGSRRAARSCPAPTRSGTSAAATTSSSRGWSAGCPAGTVHLGERLVAVRSRGHGRYTCTFSCGAAHPRRTRRPRGARAAVHEAARGGTARDRAAAAAAAGHPRGTARHQREDRSCSSPAGSGTPTTGPGNMYTDGIVQGGWETTVGPAGHAGILIALPGGEVGADIGRRYGLTSYEGPAPDGHGQRLPRLLRRRTSPAPGRPTTARRTTPGRPGDPHIGGAYSYLKTGQYTALQRHPGTAAREPALRRGAHLGELPGLHGRRAAQRLPLRGRDH